ncbi:transcription factor bHLH18-like [Silene latifolia]|uniref:transcription factor bHLH18-like n=1 Tax=Silene latifolia TaxID=37657 RepID=UPI003D78034C
MEAWLSELGMAWNEGTNLSNNNTHEEDMDTISEELAAVLGDDFAFTNFNEETTMSSLLNCTIIDQNPTNNLLGQCDQQLPPLSNNDYSPTSIEPIITNDQITNINNIATKNSSVLSDEHVAANTSGRKRRRDPEQVQGHILAERKRRELLSQRFIALSAMVPGLKKIDKTSILEEAIKHLKQMQDRVKILEEATSKQVAESITVVKRKQIVMIKDTETSSVVENVNGSVTSSGGSDDGDNGNQVAELPEIEVKMTPKTLLLKICCVRRKGILGTIYKEVEIHGMIVLNSNIMVFEAATLDITILAKIEKAEGYDKQVKDLLRTLYSILRV